MANLNRNRNYHPIGADNNPPVVRDIEDGMSPAPNNRRMPYPKELISDTEYEIAKEILNMRLSIAASFSELSARLDNMTKILSEIQNKSQIAEPTPNNHK